MSALGLPPIHIYKFYGKERRLRYPEKRGYLTILDSGKDEGGEYLLIQVHDQKKAAQIDKVLAEKETSK